MISYQDEWATLYVGGALDVLRQLPDQSVNCSICSPPYWGLRSYLSPEHPDKGSELGTEKTPDLFVAKLVEVFGELWRVLRDDGQLWVNIGDSYNSGSSGGLGGSTLAGGQANQERSNRNGRGYVPGLKPKDLCMVPARLAIALQSWGWYLRQELVWAKDSAMPESVKDRCTRSHEYIYMLTKKPRYFYDQDAIREPHAESSHKRAALGFTTDGTKYNKEKPDTPVGNLRNGSNPLHSAGRNARSVWRINPKPYPGSHFATYPPELPMRCIRAGTSEYGVCSICLAPWRRVVEHGEVLSTGGSNKGARASNMDGVSVLGQKVGNAYNTGNMVQRAKRTVGWEPTCTHDSGVIPATVLDPFCGSGTTLYAARKLGRRSVGIDLDEKSAELLRERFGNQGVLL